MKYFIHDNGSRPIRAEVAGNFIALFRRIIDREYSSVPFYNREVLRIMIGESPLNEMTEYSDGHGPYFDGNSILIEEPEGTYVFVGMETRRFRPLNPITFFLSPVGNNDVPYPYARDSENNVYLFTEHVVLTTCPIDVENPYRWYYNHFIISNHMCENGEPSLDHAVENIHHYHPPPALGFDPEIEYQLTYKGDWRSDHHRLVGGTVVHTDNTTQLMTAEYVEALMRRVEARSGFVHLETLLLQHRL